MLEEVGGWGSLLGELWGEILGDDEDRRMGGGEGRLSLSAGGEWGEEGEGE